MRVRDRAELGPTEDAVAVAAQLAVLAGVAPAAFEALPWPDKFDFTDRLRRTVLHDLPSLGLAAAAARLASGGGEAASGDPQDDVEFAVCDLALPVLCALARDRRVSVAKNGVEALADMFARAGPAGSLGGGGGGGAASAVGKPVTEALGLLLEMLGAGSAAKTLKVCLSTHQGGSKHSRSHVQRH